jgi:predicted methyltransferase
LNGEEVMNEKTYWFDAQVARRALDALARGAASVDISVDLNRTRATFALADDALLLDGDQRLTGEELRLIARKEQRIFILENGELEVLEARDGDYYKLVPTDQAPLLEISGVKMHIAKGINPFESAGKMAAQVVKSGDRVLDTCSGLGYAASAALRLGAREVVSVELSATVIELRRRNPWSQEIYHPDVTLVQADIGDYIGGLAAESFDAIIHDPPRFSLAGELYGERFYRELYRVLKRRGALFHYTGNPYKVKRGDGFMEQAGKRLGAAGFGKVVKVAELMGLRAVKVTVQRKADHPRRHRLLSFSLSPGGTKGPTSWLKRWGIGVSKCRRAWFTGWVKDNDQACNARWAWAGRSCAYFLSPTRGCPCSAKWTRI